MRVSRNPSPTARFPGVVLLIRLAQLCESAAARGIEADPGALDQIAASDASPFATETVAELLEQQGDVEGARQLRTSLGPGRESAPEEAASAPSHAIATLEQWLGNLRRARA